MSKTIRTYTTEFKQDAVEYVETHQDLTIKDAAEHLGVPKDTLYGWVNTSRRKIRAGDGEPVRGNLTDSEKEINRLRRENKDLKDALEILKKAISILGD